MNQRTDGSIVGQQDPAFNAFAITPSDLTDLSIPARALFVGTAGDIKITLPGGGTVTFKNCSAGILPVAGIRIWSTGTTATDLIGLE